MTAAAPRVAAGPDLTPWPPGIRVQERTPAARGPAPRLASGVPAFVGFARPVAEALERDGVPAVVVEHWHALEFAQRLRPAGTGFLASAVRGFFANGGTRCVVLAAAPPPPGGDGTAALLRVLAPGGVLEDRTDIDLVCIPDAVSPLVREDAWRAVHAAALAHCGAMGDRFAILDAPDGEPSDSRLPAGLPPPLRSAFGAIYVPWIQAEPATDGPPARRPRGAAAGWRCLPGTPPQSGGAVVPAFVPPSGHVAGLYARTDAVVGTQHAPANETLEDAVDVSVGLTAAQHGRLNEAGINALLAVRGRGVHVGGARTLSSRAGWAHVPTARTVLAFRRWLPTGLHDLVFEPNTPALWERVRVRLVSRCVELQQSGALEGGDGAPAFFVKCDAETNRPGEGESGRVVAHVGLAPSAPAEFVVIRVIRDASGFTLGGLS